MTSLLPMGGSVLVIAAMTTATSISVPGERHAGSGRSAVSSAHLNAPRRVR